MQKAKETFNYALPKAKEILNNAMHNARGISMIATLKAKETFRMIAIKTSTMKEKNVIVAGVGVLFTMILIVQFLSAPASTDMDYSTQMKDPTTAAVISEQPDSILDDTLALLPTIGQHYQPGVTEQYVIDNAHKLGLDKTSTPKYFNRNKPSCAIWLDRKVSPHYQVLQQYRDEIQQYKELVEKFHPVKDLRRHLDDERTICQKLEVIPEGLSRVFPSGQLSFASKTGHLEPLLPPLRDPEYCVASQQKEYKLSLGYIVHDFAAMCRTIQPTSRTVLIDMGASLDFHDHDHADSPALYLMELYRKFGFPFDHIYAYEITPADPGTVLELVPDAYRAAYHWINVGVSADPASPRNPWKMLLDHFEPDDLIVVKMDIDHPGIEMALIRQIFQDDRLAKLIDHLYFEHHVHLKELAKRWGSTMQGSVVNSLQLFQGLREKGIAAHYWV